MRLAGLAKLGLPAVLGLSSGSDPWNHPALVILIPECPA
jgi:hypothetical protein